MIAIFKKYGGWLMVFGAFASVAILVLLVMGKLSWAVELPDVEHIESIGQPADQPAEVFSLAIHLDCRARTYASVPVSARRVTEIDSGSIFGFELPDIPTGHIDVGLIAKGDIDTCFEGGGIDVFEDISGIWHVQIDASEVRFVRPRVDMRATAESVWRDENIGYEFFDWLTHGFMGDDDDLKENALAFAQDVIGGSSCMQAAWGQTQAAITASLIDEASEKGIEILAENIVFVNVPDFTQNQATEFAYEGIEFSLNHEEVECVAVSPHADLGD